MMKLCMNNGDEKLINTFVLKKNFDYNLFYFKIIFIKKLLLRLFCNNKNKFFEHLGIFFFFFTETRKETCKFETLGTLFFLSTPTPPFLTFEGEGIKGLILRHCGKLKSTLPTSCCSRRSWIAAAAIHEKIRDCVQ